MAPEFNVITLRKNHELNRYFAKINFDKSIGNYEINTNANIRYLDWIDEFSMLNGLDQPFDELPYFRIKGLDEIGQKHEKGLEKAFLDFIQNECWEGND